MSATVSAPSMAALAAGQLQNKVQAVLPRPRHPLRSQPGVSDGNSPVSRRQQITLRATLIFHLIDGLLSTTIAHEVRRAGLNVLTCGSCHLERSGRPHPHRSVVNKDLTFKAKAKDLTSEQVEGPL